MLLEAKMRKGGFPLAWMQFHLHGIYATTWAKIAAIKRVDPLSYTIQQSNFYVKELKT